MGQAPGMIAQSGVVASLLHSRATGGRLGLPGTQHGAHWRHVCCVPGVMRNGQTTSAQFGSHRGKDECYQFLPDESRQRASLKSENPSTSGGAA